MTAGMRVFGKGIDASVMYVVTVLLSCALLVS